MSYTWDSWREGDDPPELSLEQKLEHEERERKEQRDSFWFGLWSTSGLVGLFSIIYGFSAFSNRTEIYKNILKDGGNPYKAGLIATGIGICLIGAAVGLYKLRKNQTQNPKNT